jgi:hypothetical protein
VLGGPGPARQPRHSTGGPPSRQGAQAAAEVPGGLPVVVNTCILSLELLTIRGRGGIYLLIRMFLGRPDSLVRGTDPDPYIIKQNSKKKL